MPAAEKASPFASPVVPAILGAGVCGVVLMLGLSHRSAVRSERAQGVLAAGQQALLAHAALRSRVGPLVASGSYLMDCSDARAAGWFKVALAGGNVASAGRAHVSARRAPGGLADVVGMGKERPWTVTALRLECNVEAIEARKAARREVAVRAGYVEEGAAHLSARDALLELGGAPGEGGLIELVVVAEETHPREKEKQLAQKVV